MLSDGKVGISGTNYIPKIPIKEEVNNELSKIMQIKSPTLRAIKMMLYGMRSQLFWDENKRTSMILLMKL